MLCSARTPYLPGDDDVAAVTRAICLLLAWFTRISISRIVSAAASFTDSSSFLSVSTSLSFGKADFAIVPPTCLLLLVEVPRCLHISLRRVPAKALIRSRRM